MAPGKLHIVHVVYRFDTGGLENGVVNLINRLPEEQYEHSIVTQQGANPEFCRRLTTSNVQFFDLHKAEGTDLGYFIRLNQLLKRLRPDILHTRNLSALESQLVGWWRRIPLRIHGEHGWDMSDIGGVNLKYQKLRRLLRHFIHRYVALSSESRRYLIDKIGVKEQYISHICNGVDTQKFQHQQALPSVLPVELQWQDALVFGTVGRLAEVKNQAYLIDAFARLLDRLPAQRHRLALLIVGDGHMRDKLEQQVRAAGIGDRVWFAGNRDDVPVMMQAMDVFVLPSLAEGISNTILEAMASGLPVIATRVGGNGDLVMPGHAVDHLVPVGEPERLADAMSRYALDPTSAGIEGMRVKKHCQRLFSLDTMVSKYHDLYQQKAG